MKKLELNPSLVVMDNEYLNARGYNYLTRPLYILLGIAAIPWIYYVLVLYSTVSFFRRSRKEYPPNTDFTPPVSCLKPIRGLDVEAYENYASFCRQDYPDYEILFCVDQGDPALSVIEKLIRDFPERRIRILFGSGRDGINDKVARLVRLVNEAQHDLLVITDGDVRVRPDYLRAMVSPFRDRKVGSATCLYTSTKEVTFLQELAVGFHDLRLFRRHHDGMETRRREIHVRAIYRHHAQEHRRFRRV